MSEIGKAYRNAGERPGLTFFRDRHGLEVDVIAELGLLRAAIEIKSAETVASDAFASVDAVTELMAKAADGSNTERVLVYAGSERVHTAGVSVLPWSHVGSHAWPGLAHPVSPSAC